MIFVKIFSIHSFCLSLLLCFCTSEVVAQELEVIGKIKIVDGNQGVGKVLTSDANGEGTWSSPGLSIGDMHLGGIIFYLDGSRQHGLIAKLTDEPGTYHWSDSTFTTGAFADGPHGGAFNARKILEIFSAGSAPATQACKNVSVGNLFDWYLPSRYELYLMYMNIGPGAPAPLTNIGGFASAPYWSSTEFQETGEKCCAHYIDFSNARYNEDNNKTDTFYQVRAVHAF